MSSRSTERLGERLEVLFALLALLLTMDLLFSMLALEGAEVTPQDLGVQGSLPFMVTASITYAIVCAFLIARYRQVMPILRRHWLLIALVQLTVLSTVWSVNPEVTLRRSLALAATTALAVYLATRFDARQFLSLMIVAVTIAALLHIGCVLLLPQYGIHETADWTGAWRGVAVHKNVMGRWMALGSVLFLLRMLERRRPHWFFWSGFLLTTLLVVMSQSRTAWIATGLLICCVCLFRWFGTSGSAILVGAVVLTVALAIAGSEIADYTQTALYAVGKDPTLTGRTVLWEAAYGFGMKQPWLGYGYRAFWLGSAGGSQALWDELGWMPNTGHNGFLDLWLDVGFIGVILFLLILLPFAVRTVRAFARKRSPTALWHIAFLVFFMALTIPDGMILNQNNLSWVVFVVSVIHVDRASEKQPEKER